MEIITQIVNDKRNINTLNCDHEEIKEKIFFIHINIITIRRLFNFKFLYFLIPIDLIDVIDTYFMLLLKNDKHIICKVDSLNGDNISFY